MPEPEEMPQELLMAIRARLDEPPPLIALAERNQGSTALIEYLRRLQEDRIALVDEIDRLRAEVQGPPLAVPGELANLPGPGQGPVSPLPSEPPAPDRRAAGDVPREPMQLLQIRTEGGPDCQYLRLIGELDMSSAPSLQEALSAAEAAAPPLLVIDLRRLTFIDSSGLHLLLGAQEWASHNHRRLTLIRGTSAVHTAFEITGLDKTFVFEPAPSAAGEGAPTKP
ncbi:MAG: hypothetical protein NVSMB32_06420 [Actinomycetota bacterium]